MLSPGAGSVSVSCRWVGWSWIHPRLRGSSCSPHWPQWRPSNVSSCWRGNAKASGRLLKRGNIVGALQPPDESRMPSRSFARSASGLPRSLVVCRYPEHQFIGSSERRRQHNSAIQMSCAKSSGPGHLPCVGSLRRSSGTDRLRGDRQLTFVAPVPNRRSARVASMSALRPRWSFQAASPSHECGRSPKCGGSFSDVHNGWRPCEKALLDGRCATSRRRDGSVKPKGIKGTSSECRRLLVAVTSTTFSPASVDSGLS